MCFGNSTHLSHVRGLARGLHVMFVSILLSHIRGLARGLHFTSHRVYHVGSRASVTVCLQPFRLCRAWLCVAVTSPFRPAMPSPAKASPQQPARAPADLPTSTAALAPASAAQAPELSVSTAAEAPASAAGAPEPAASAAALAPVTAASAPAVPAEAPSAMGSWVNVAPSEEPWMAMSSCGSVVALEQ